MTIQRMDNVLIVVDDLEAAKAFFAELGMELEGEAPVEGRWVDRVIGLNDVRADIAMMRTPDGHSRLGSSCRGGASAGKRALEVRQFTSQPCQVVLMLAPFVGDGA